MKLAYHLFKFFNTFSFKETPYMSAYLFALAITNYDYIESTNRQVNIFNIAKLYKKMLYIRSLELSGSEKKYERWYGHPSFYCGARG